MKHTILTVLLTLGVVLGITSGVCGLRHHHHHRREHWERHVAEVCIQAARGVPLASKPAPP